MLEFSTLQKQHQLNFHPVQAKKESLLVDSSAKMEAKHRGSATRAIPESNDTIKATNPLQSDFEDTASMDSDERYLVRAR